jgi:hypothetical protein
VAKHVPSTYCSHVYGKQLIVDFGSKDVVLAVQRDFRSAGLSQRDVEMLTYAETISKNASRVTHEQIERLRSVGFTDVQICDIALCAAFRCFISRFFDAVGAGPEPAFLDTDANFRSAQKWSRGQVEARLANMQPCLIGMEACIGAHHLSRKLQMLGHDARLMPAKYVRPYSKGQKNDFRDAEAIAEAVQRPTMKFVATKTADQLDLQALHRVRQRLVSQRTGIINQIRAFLLERGVAVRQGLHFLRAELPNILAKRTDVLSPRMLRLIEDLAGDWRRL